MNKKRLVVGSGVALLCTSLIAYGAGPPVGTVSATKTNAQEIAATSCANTATNAKLPAWVGARGATAAEATQTCRILPKNQAPVDNEAYMVGPLAPSTMPGVFRGFRDAPANDACADAEFITGPYPVNVCASNVGATTDCPGVLDREAVWYEIDLPYAVNKLVVDYCPTAFSLSSYQIGTVYFDDCDCASPVVGRYNWVDCGDGTSNPEIRWLDVPGPGTVLLPVFLNPADDFCIEINVTEIVQPANDECENAEFVTGPYPTTVCGTNEGATADCPDDFNWEAVWYEIDLPYTVNNLVADFCPNDFSVLSYQIGTLYLNDCNSCNAPVNGSYEIHDCGTNGTNAYVRWSELPGPGTVLVPAYINPAHEFCIEFNVIEVAQPPNDVCIDAELVTGPYPTTVCGTNQGATVDCPGVLDWNAVWYEVELPYDINTVETDYCATDINMSSDTVGIVYYEDCSDCTAAVVGNYEWHNCDNFNYNPAVWWRDVPGPGTMMIPIWIEPSHEFCFDINVRDGDCKVPCPSGGVPEGELCGNDTNGGCFMATPTFVPLTCGQTVCGTAWANPNTRDTDWYEIVITEPTTMTFTVEAEFLTGVQAGLVETLTPGVASCDEVTGLLVPYDRAVDCEQLTVTYNAYPGTYWWFVSPDRFLDMPCGGSNRYTATMDCEPWEVRGACCDDVTGICSDNELYQDCAEPLRFTKDTFCADIKPPCGGCPESMIEIEIRTDRYPGETTWEITDQDSGAVIASGGPYETGFETYFDYVCIDSNGCVDFTVYDQAGDGQSFGNGGYAVRLDGVELCSTLENSWVGFEHTCSYVGRGCATGRCCYDPWPGCADVSLFECVDTYDGLWIEGLNCIDDPCQDPDAPDFDVTAPFTSPQRSTCGALNRCQPTNQYYSTPEHVYGITIPYDGVWSFNTCQDTSIPTFLAVGSSICGEDIGWSNWACNGVAAEVVAYLTAGEYFADVEGYSDCGNYVFDVHEVPVCNPMCPETATYESEPCGGNSNNGCWGWPNAFEPIEQDQPICGTIYADNGYDTDWFEFVATADDTMTLSVRTNFTGRIGVAQQAVPGQPGCNNFTGMIEPFVDTADCEEASVSFPVTAGGTYYVYIGHLSSYGSPCGTTNDYVATLTGTNTLCGDLDGDNDCDTDDYSAFLDTYGTCEGSAKYLPEADSDGDDCVTAVDYQYWLMCYRDYVGDPTAMPTLSDDDDQDPQSIEPSEKPTRPNLQVQPGRRQSLVRPQ